MPSLIAADNHLQLLQRLTDRLAAATTLDEMFQAAIDAMVDGMRVERASLLLFDENDVMAFRAWRGLSAGYRQAVEGHTPWPRGTQNPDPIFVDDVEHEPSCADLLPVFRAEGIRALAFLPLTFRGWVIGKFMVYGDRPTDWRAYDLTLVAFIASLVALAIELRRTELDAREAHDQLRDLLEERQRLQEQMLQAQKMESLGALAGGIAHDFNNLLTAILGYADLLRLQLEVGKAQVETVDELIRAGQQAANVTRQLLAFARRQPYAPKVVDIGRVVDETLGMIRNLLGPQILLVSRHRPGPFPVRTDASQFQQVLLNLVVNARDAMPNGGELQLSLAEIELKDAEFGLAPGRYAELVARDNGVGMSDSTRRRALEPFFTTKEKGRGTGLGLSTCYGIVHQIGGELLLDSTLGQGTTVRVLVPLSPEPVENDDGGPGSPALQRERQSTILVVDDEPHVRRVISAVLHQKGFRVLEASDGVEAMGLLERENTRISVLISDILMPRMNGWELIAEVRHRFPELPAILISGYSETSDDHQEQLAELERGEALQFLAKPFLPLVLIDKVEALLRQAKTA